MEVLHISSRLSESYWSVVEQLPHVVYEAVPLIFDDKLYVAMGYDDDCESTCSIVTAWLPELLQNSITKTAQVWKKLPDMPYSSCSISHYQGHLIIFSGDRKVEQSGISQSAWKLVQLRYLYNPHIKSWDYVGDDFHDYELGRSIHVGENKIFFMGGLTGTFTVGKEDDMVKTCSVVTLTPK